MTLVPTQAFARVTVSVAGVPLGSFITKEGGETDSEELKIRQGGGEEETSFGSMPTHGAVTVAKLYDSEMKARAQFLRASIGKPMVVSDQPLDADKNPYGPADTYTGTLKRFSPPDRDANATGEFALCELEMTTDGVA